MPFGPILVHLVHPPIPTNAVLTLQSPRSRFIPRFDPVRGLGPLGLQVMSVKLCKFLFGVREGFIRLPLAALLGEQLHVEVAVVLKPGLMGLDAHAAPRGSGVP